MNDMYTLPRGIEITHAVLNDVIKYAEEKRKRFEFLENYYNGKHSIFDRIKANDGCSNNKVMINHAKYITDITTGYFMGKPVDYQTTEQYNIEPLLKVYKDQTINDLDMEIAENVSIMGSQFEYVYSNENAEPRSCLLDNRNAVIVYDDTVEHKKLFGLMYRPIYKGNTLIPDHYEIVYCDDHRVVKYISTDKEITKVGEETPHTFGDVPMIEYKNNPRKQGDFECVISLIDAYNLLQSDRVNDKEQLVDAILLMYGVDFDSDQMQQLKTYRCLANIPEGARVEYLTKMLNETQVDVLRENIENDIFKISATPNMTDKEFAQNSSGVAMKYKLLPFEQRVGRKERYMEKSLMERFELYNNFLVSKSMMQVVPITEVDAIFKRNLPNNDFETSQMINNLSDLVDKETLVSQLSFIKDASEIVELKNQEKLENQEMFGMNNYNNSTFGDYPDANKEEETK